jgi:hypothetical protein
MEENEVVSAATEEERKSFLGPPRKDQVDDSCWAGIGTIIFYLVIFWFIK